MPKYLRSNAPFAGSVCARYGASELAAKVRTNDAFSRMMMKMCPGLLGASTRAVARGAEVAAASEMTRSAAAAVAARERVEFRVILNCTIGRALRSAPSSMPGAEDGAHDHEIYELVAGIDHEYRKLLSGVDVRHEADRRGEAEPDMRAPQRTTPPRVRVQVIENQLKDRRHHEKADERNSVRPGRVGLHARDVFRRVRVRGHPLLREEERRIPQATDQEGDDGGNEDCEIVVHLHASLSAGGGAPNAGKNVRAELPARKARPAPVPLSTELVISARTLHRLRFSRLPDHGARVPPEYRAHVRLRCEHRKRREVHRHDHARVEELPD